MYRVNISMHGRKVHRLQKILLKGHSTALNDLSGMKCVLMNEIPVAVR